MQAAFLSQQAPHCNQAQPCWQRAAPARPPAPPAPHLLIHAGGPGGCDALGGGECGRGLGRCAGERRGFRCGGGDLWVRGEGEGLGGFGEGGAASGSGLGSPAGSTSWPSTHSPAQSSLVASRQQRPAFSAQPQCGKPWGLRGQSAGRGERRGRGGGEAAGGEVLLGAGADSRGGGEGEGEAVGEGEGEGEATGDGVGGGSAGAGEGERAGLAGLGGALSSARAPVSGSQPELVAAPAWHSACWALCVVPSAGAGRNPSTPFSSSAAVMLPSRGPRLASAAAT